MVDRSLISSALPVVGIAAGLLIGGFTLPGILIAAALAGGGALASHYISANATPTTAPPPSITLAVPAATSSQVSATTPAVSAASSAVTNAPLSSSASVPPATSSGPTTDQMLDRQLSNVQMNQMLQNMNAPSSLRVGSAATDVITSGLDLIHVIRSRSNGRHCLPTKGVRLPRQDDGVSCARLPHLLLPGAEDLPAGLHDGRRLAEVRQPRRQGREDSLKTELSLRQVGYWSAGNALHYCWLRIIAQCCIL